MSITCLLQDVGLIELAFIQVGPNWEETKDLMHLLSPSPTRNLKGAHTTTHIKRCICNGKVALDHSPSAYTFLIKKYENYVHDH